MLRRFAASLDGNLSMMAAGLMAAAAFISACVIDYTSVVGQNQNLQGLADHAALAAAQELVVSQATDVRVTAVAQRFVAAGYTQEQTTSAAIMDSGRAVQVTIEARPQTFFPDPITSGIKVVKVSSTAAVSGGGYVCMIGLDQKSVATLNMMNKARLSATKCAVYSNSLSSKSFWLHDTARVAADLVCISGGLQGPVEAFTQSKPVLDCPAIDDPLRDRPKPAMASQARCDYSNETVTFNKTVTLQPGVYCGGITVAGGHATLAPGIYVIRGGPLFIAGGTLEGTNVGFFLTGSASTVNFGANSHVSLTAPKTGDLAGLLFFEDRDTSFSTFHQISSNDARSLVGTMYFPKSKLLINANNPVADQSEYTIIIAREFELRDGPVLVLNTNYEASPIPVPKGIGNNIETKIHLVK